MQNRAEQYFDTAPQTDEPLDDSWRDLHSDHEAPLALKTGDRKVTMTFDDFLEKDHKVKSREADDLSAIIARVKIANIMCE